MIARRKVLRVFVSIGEVSSGRLKEFVWLHVNEQMKEDAHLRRIQGCGCLVDDALEGANARLALFLAAGLLGLVLLLLAVELGLALLFNARLGFPPYAMLA